MTKKLVFTCMMLASCLYYAAGNPLGGLATPDGCRAILRGDSADVLRRKAFKKLLYKAETFEEAVVLGMEDRDPRIRSAALFELFVKDEARALPCLRRMAEDPAPEVCIMAAQLLRAMKDKGLAAEMATEMIRKTRNPEVRRAASRALGFNFFKDVKLYSNNPAHDYDVVCLQAVELPQEGWRFMQDEGETGHLGRSPYYLEKLDDSAWAPIAIGMTWERQGYKGYDGIAWYRLTFTLPEMPTGAQATELQFLGVDECAWVWVNGAYVGQHNMGTMGWNVPFRLDVSQEIRWGKENTIVVRVEDTENGGGIYKGIKVEAMK